MEAKHKAAYSAAIRDADPGDLRVLCYGVEALRRQMIKHHKGNLAIIHHLEATNDHEDNSNEDASEDNSYHDAADNHDLDINSFWNDNGL